MRSLLLLIIFVPGIALSCLAQGSSSPAGQQVLASYEDRKITLDEFSTKYPALMSWLGISVKSQQVEEALESMLLNELMAREAQSSGLSSQPAVKAQIDKILATAYMKQRIPREQIVVDETEVDRYYRKHQDEFKNSEQLRLSQLVTSSRDEAEKLRQEIKGGATFASVAEKRSTDALSAKRGGTLGLLPAAQLLPELRSAAGKLSVGELSQPIKTSLGYHLILVEEQPRITYRPLEEVRKDIYGKLSQQKELEKIEELKKELWSRFGVSVISSSIDQLVKQQSSHNATVEKASLGRVQRQPGQATDLQLVTETVNLGRIAPRKVTETLVMANASDKDINIIRVGSTCKCIEVTPEETVIKPGAKARLKFTYDPAMFAETGEVQKMLFIESSDMIESRKFVKVNAEVSGG